MERAAAWLAGLGVLVMRLFGRAPMLRADPGPAALEPLAAFGVRARSEPREVREVPAAECVGVLGVRRV